MTCHYCGQPIKKGQPKTTRRSRMTNVQTGKSYPFLGDLHFHTGCLDQLARDRAELSEKLILKGYKVTI